MKWSPISMTIPKSTFKLALFWILLVSLLLSVFLVLFSTNHFLTSESEPSSSFRSPLSVLSPESIFLDKNNFMIKDYSKVNVDNSTLSSTRSYKKTNLMSERMVPSSPGGERTDGGGEVRSGKMSREEEEMKEILANR